MKILYVTHRFPFPPNRGGKIRPFNMIKHLTGRGDEVTVCSIARSAGEAQAGEGLNEYCHRSFMAVVKRPVQALRMAARLPTSTPSSMGFFYSRSLDRDIQRLLATESFDLIFAHCSSVAPYVAHVTGTPKILDYGDMDSHKWLSYRAFKPWPLSWGYWLEGTKLMAAEKRLAPQFDLCTATTRAERETLDSYETGVLSDWFPNGVNAEYFAPDETAYDTDTICFVGRMDYYPNQECMYDFVANTFPLIRKRRPNAKLLIVGANPIPQVHALAETPGVEVTGSVPDVRPYLRRSALMVAPLNIARGTQNKILEALAMEVPVVCTTLAAGGVDAVDGEHMLAADGPADSANACLRFMDDAEERRQFAEAGRARMLSHHSWSGSMQRFDGIIGRVARPPQQAVPAESKAT